MKSKKGKIKEIKESIDYNIILTNKIELDFQKNMSEQANKLAALLIQLQDLLKK